jgi:hypothetical protein
LLFINYYALSVARQKPYPFGDFQFHPVQENGDILVYPRYIQLYMTA